jgi:ubiquinone/menaquinone biosynthesis C-methylase UbiE
MTDIANPPRSLRSPPRVAPAVSTLSSRPSPATALSIRMSRTLWRRRAQSWEQQGSTKLTEVVRTVLAHCGHTSGAVAVDLGCGSGQVSLPLARRCRHVVAIDIDPGAAQILHTRATREAVSNIQAVVQPVETVAMGPGSVDLVVSNYALHHLRDADKRQVIGRSFDWLRPGGRLVIGDMMFGRGADPVDREIIRGKVRELIRRGPGGWWRIVKNAWRFLLRLQEKPLTAAAWESIIREAGFANVRTSRVAAEACVISADKPRPRAVTAPGVSETPDLWTVSAILVPPIATAGVGDLEQDGGNKQDPRRACHY